MINPLAALDRLEATGAARLPLMSTGFADIDDVTGGFGSGQVWIICGTPGQGRTTLAIQWALQTARAHRLTTHLVSGREPEDLVAARLVANIGKVPAAHLWKGEFTETDAVRLVDARESLADLPMQLVGPGQISSLSGDLGGEDMPDVLVVDDADLFAEAFPKRIGELAAKGVLVILSLPRANVVTGVGIDPEWARIADFIINIDRPDHLEPTSLRPGEADIFLLRNRWGPQRSTTIHFHGHYARFVEVPPRRA